MKEAYQIAQRNAKKTAERGKEYYNKRVFQLGDWVLVRNLTERGGPGKLQSHWEHVIRVVDDRIGHQSLVELNLRVGVLARECRVTFSS